MTVAECIICGREYRTWPSWVADGRKCCSKACNLLYRRRRTPIEYLLSNYIPVPFSGCWLWLGPCNPKGYGQVSPGRGVRREYAHRMMLSLTQPTDNEKLFACHRCDVPSCINPDHLFWGTQSDNMRDASAKGRIRENNTAKTHCPHGHPYDDSNTFINKRGARMCKVCMRIRQKYYMTTEAGRAMQDRRNARMREKRAAL